MIYFKWRYYNEKLKKQIVLKIPTGFAPMIFQDFYERLVERYAIQLDWCVYSKSWQSFAAFDNIIIIHTYHWTCNRSTIGILKEYSCMNEHSKKSLSYLNGSKGIQPAEFFCTIWRGFKFKTPFNRLLYTIEIKLWVWPLTLFTK